VLRPGDRVALVAPASAFVRAELDAGIEELRTLGFDPVYDESVFERRNDSLYVRRQLPATRDMRPDCHWRRHDQGTIQTNRVEIVMPGPLRVGEYEWTRQSSQLAFLQQPVAQRQRLRLMRDRLLGVELQYIDYRIDQCRRIARPDAERIAGSYPDGASVKVLAVDQRGAVGPQVLHSTRRRAH